ncbi:MAG: ParB/RepB/Spo0J family partition protein [Ktedonobacteraceae bacterium]|nr:ParB/RepB/Spo0J family partition protein [Ktedonobacteraceae bacterium]
MATGNAKGKRSRSGFSASYLSGLSQQADEADIFGPDIAQKYEELQQEIEEVATDASHLRFLSIALLENNPWQGRQQMDAEELKNLSADIKENGFHEAMPVVVRPHPTMLGTFQIVWGHRRTRAAEMAGLEAVPTLVKDYSDEDMIFLQAKENLLREQLTPVDEAAMFQNMLQLGYTQEKVAEKVKKSRGYIRNRLELMKSQEDVLAMVRQDPETVRAAYYLNKIDDPSLRADLIQALLAKKITGEGISGYLATIKEQHQTQASAPLASSDTSSGDLFVAEEDTHAAESKALASDIETDIVEGNEASSGSALRERKGRRTSTELQASSKRIARAEEAHQRLLSYKKLVGSSDDITETEQHLLREMFQINLALFDPYTAQLLQDIATKRENEGAPLPHPFQLVAQAVQLLSEREGK